MQLHIEHLSKHYRGNVWGLRDFNLELGPCVLGLLGPNGAGKSTVMRILATITRASDGKVTWDGVDIGRRPDTLRAVLGYLPQDFGVYPHLNASEFLAYMAALKGIKGSVARQRIDELLQVVNLAEARKRPLGSYSGGMKQRIGIAQALLNDPSLLIMDEPTVGLDPEERVRFRNLLSDLSSSRIVILSTHIVSDVEAIATDIVIMHGGSIVTHSSPENLLQSVEGKIWEWTIPAADLLAVRERYLVSGILHRSAGVQVRVISQTAPGAGATIVAPTMEDAYLACISSRTSRHADATAASLSGRGTGGVL